MGHALHTANILTTLTVPMRIVPKLVVGDSKVIFGDAIEPKPPSPKPRTSLDKLDISDAGTARNLREMARSVIDAKGSAGPNAPTTRRKTPPDDIP